MQCRQTWLRSSKQWLRVQRPHSKARPLCIASFARLPAQRRAAGPTEAAVQLALRLLALDPLREAGHRTLMRLYAQLGRRDAALRQYQVCVAGHEGPVHSLLQRIEGEQP